jgi:type IV pilus assembly protein PilA
MIARIHKSMEEKDRGFTLIELLVVIIIIGILAAIAIPVFLNQRRKGWDAAVQSDLKNAATAMETYLTEEGTYVGADIPALEGLGFNYSADGNYLDNTPQITIVPNGADDYTLTATAASSLTWVYDAAAGGIQPQP